MSDTMDAHIDLRLFATLHHLTPENAATFTIRPGMTIGELIRNLDIPESEVKVVFVNSRRREFDFTLNPGDRVGIFPPVGGG